MYNNNEEKLNSKKSADHKMLYKAEASIKITINNDTNLEASSVKNTLNSFKYFTKGYNHSMIQTNNTAAENKTTTKFSGTISIEKADRTHKKVVNKVKNPKQSHEKDNKTTTDKPTISKLSYTSSLKLTKNINNSVTKAIKTTSKTKSTIKTRDKTVNADDPSSTINSNTYIASNKNKLFGNKHKPEDAVVAKRSKTWNGSINKSK